MPKIKLIPVLKTKCATCPFRKGSPYAFLAPDLANSAMSQASRICHNTASPLGCVAAPGMCN